MPRPAVFLPAMLGSLLLAPRAAAQPATSRPPERGGHVYSLGMPPIWKGHAGFTAGWFKPADESQLDVLGHLGLMRDLMSPVAGVAAIGAEGYGGLRDDRTGVAGVRGFFSIPALHLSTGGDYSITDDDFSWLIRLEVTTRRSGVFGRGTQLRFDYLPGRGNSFAVGINAPLWGSNIGKTRPQRDAIELEDPPVSYVDRPAELAPEAGLLGRFEERAIALTRLVMPLLDEGGADAAEAYAPVLDSLAAGFEAGRGLPEAWDDWHEALEQAFLAAVGPSARPGAAAEVTAAARQVLLDEVLLPYDRLLGQRKVHDGLTQFAAAAHAGFERWMLQSGTVPRSRYDAATWTFQQAVRAIESVHAFQRGRWEDTRLIWLPLQLALRPGDVDTQAEMDALLERATAQRFTNGNNVWYVMNEQFQVEFWRSVHATRRYHVLWIHDYRGRNGGGDPDKVGFGQTVDGYFAALADRVAEYDSTGVIPEYFIFLDQNYFEANDTRLWFRLLRDPLQADLALPPGHEDWEQQFRAAQQRLRDAVAGSRVLQAERRQYGDEWLRRRIKVHVNITNPSDFSFTSLHVAGIIPVPDNVIRDHRKIAFYDLTEDDPYAGMAMYTGMGVGEHYAGANWEDRAIMVQGPAALTVKHAARALVEQQGFDHWEIPLALRVRPFAEDYDVRVQARVDTLRADPLARLGRVLELHNQTGYADKPINVQKAILYSMMPAGSVLKVPDSLWQSYVYASLLTGSALRGCRVVVVAPSLASAPSAAAPTMARAHGLLSALVAFQGALGPEIERRGGLLRTGLYAPRAGVGDFTGRLRQASELNAPWMRELLQSTAERRRILDSLVTVTEQDSTRYLVQADTTERPKLHLKANIFVDGASWDVLMAQAAWIPVLREYVAYLADAPRRWREGVLTMPEPLREAAGQLGQATVRTLGERGVASSVSYFTVGSTNLNYRSMVLDGEVQVTVTGWDALAGIVDFLLLIGLSEWPETQAELDALLPPPSGFNRSVANLLRMLL